MAATFVVEDGTRPAGANSYISVADADQYDLNFINSTTWQALSPEEKQMVLRKSTKYLDAAYSDKWKGIPVDSQQALDYPRFEVIDENGYYRDSAIIPQELKDATVEMAIKALAEDIIPDIANPGAVSSYSVSVGPVSESTSYVGGNTPVKYYRKVDRILLPLLTISSKVFRG